jgi:uncharacterized membrane protein YbhN (UPF0104 family)
MSPLAIATCLLAHYMSLLAQSVPQVYMGRTLEVQLNWWESHSLTIVGRAGNLFTPFRAGAIFRALYMKRVHRMPFARFASMFFGFSLIVFATNALVATLTVIIAFSTHNEINWVLIVFLSFGLAASLFLIGLPANLQWYDGRWISRLTAFLQGWHSIRSSQASFLSSIIGSLVSLSMFTIAYKVVFAEIANDPGWLACAMVASIGGISRLTQFIPGSLGIYEGVITLLASTYGISPSAGLGAALFFRVCQVATLITLIGPSWIYLGNRLHLGVREVPD